MNSSFIIGSVATIGFFTLFRKFRFQRKKKDTESSSSSVPSSPNFVSPICESSSLSVPSPPTSVSRIWKHHVFPSFHGADVRKTFLSHILESFKRKGIDPFIDNNIERSKSIGPELVEAIKGSKIGIVLLSKKYASSSWCLDELVEIMKCRKLGQIVMPIFYEVDPTDIKKQSGEFGKAFIKTCKGKPKEHIERWRKALEDVAKIAGEHSCNWKNEAAMIETISINVSNMLNNSTPSRDFDGLVGMGAHMEKVEQLLRLDLVDEVRIIGIWGPPGIGKTTIARFLFNQVSNNFQLGTIMVNIKECYLRAGLDEYNAKLQLQKQMLSQITNQKDIVVPHLGVAQERLKDKKVLLVLDDVDQLEQLTALAEKIHWFGPGSRIIITTEDRRVLTTHGIEHIYKVNFPLSHEALEIFCMHAFGQNHPYEGFYKLAVEVVNLAGDLPLGLKVLGSALRGMSKPEWKRTLPRLKACLDRKIGSIIKFSYDALQDEEKYLFLYIACFFNNEYTHQVEEVLATKFSNVSQCLQVLADKSLISFKYYRIEMHTLLQQFGREASREQFVRHGLAKCHLLVGEKDICELLSDDSTDGRRFIGINFDISKSEEEFNISDQSLERMSDLQFVRINGKDVDHPYRLHSLLCHSQQIRSVDWMYFQNICLPSTFNTEFLVKLVIKYNNKLQKLWDGTKPLRNLKWMDLSFSIDLKELPDLSTASNLEELKLKYCSSLVELPSSIGKLTNLQVLNLSNCSSLVKLPSSIENATNLEDLNLKDCSNLVELPSFGNATKLVWLDLQNCLSLVKLPSSINATNLRRLGITCPRVEELFALENATNLRCLGLDNCSSLLKVPYIGTVTNLQSLCFSRCISLLNLPSFIGDFTNLIELILVNCSSLVELPVSIGTATKLKALDLSGCRSLVKLPSSIGDLINLISFDLSNCSSLLEIPHSIGAATNLQELKIRGCSSLMKLPSSIGDLINLISFDLSDCSSLVELPLSIGTATNLQKLKIRGCSSLMKLPSSTGDIINLRKLYLSDCSSLVELPSSIGFATNLQTLDISGCSSLMKLPSSIGDLINLKRFDLSNCSSLMEFPSFIANLQQLSELRMCGWSKLEAFPTNINLESLERLYLTDCSQLKSFPEISKNIEDLSLIGTAIKEVPLSIMSWSRLYEFHMSYSESLKDYPHALDIITELHLNKDIQEVAAWVKGISRLRKLILRDCNNLVSLPQFSDSLSYLDATNCKSLERLDCSFNNPWIRLDFTNCFKLNQEARDLIMDTSTRGSANLPSSQVPACFDYRATGGSPLTIKLNESLVSTSLRFKACTVLVMDNEETGDDETRTRVDIEIKDKQNDLKVPCLLWFQFIDQLLTDHIFTFEVKVKAKDVKSNELVFEFKTRNRKWKVIECGLLQILDVPTC